MAKPIIFESWQSLPSFQALNVLSFSRLLSQQYIVMYHKDGDLQESLACPADRYAILPAGCWWSSADGFTEDPTSLACDDIICMVSLRPPRGSENLIFTKLIHLVSLDPSRHKPTLNFTVYGNYHRFVMELIQWHEVFSLVNMTFSDPLWWP